MAIRKTYGANRFHYVDAASPAGRAADGEIVAFAFGGQLGIGLTRVIAGFTLDSGGANGESRILIFTADGDLDIGKLAKDLNNTTLEVDYRVRVFYDVSISELVDLDFNMQPITSEDGRSLVVLLMVPKDNLGNCLDSQMYLNVMGRTISAGESQVILPPDYRGR